MPTDSKQHLLILTSLLAFSDFVRNQGKNKLKILQNLR